MDSCFEACQDKVEMESLEIILALATVIVAGGTFLGWVVRKLIELIRVVTAEVVNSRHATENNTAVLKQIKKEMRDRTMDKIKKATR